MRAVIFTEEPGNEVIVGERPDPVPQGDELLVETTFAGINPADLQQRDGSYPPPPGAPVDVPGLEVAGRVIATGDRVLGFEVGDRVMGIVAGGGLADRVLVSERQVSPIPANLDDREAAAIPEAFLTAHDAICSQAGLRPGETLLVSGASGGVGSAAVQIAVRMGVRVVGTSRSVEGREAITAMGAHACTPQDAVETVASVSEGRGADVVLELVGAPVFANSIEALATLGRLVVVGVGAGAQVELNLRGIMGKRARILGTVLRARPSEQKGAAVQSFVKELLPGFIDGTLTAVVDTVVPMTEVIRGFAHMEGGSRVGKTLLDVTK